MFGDHPEVDAEEVYDFGCRWYSDHGPYYPALQYAWSFVGFPSIVATVLALSSICGLICWAQCCSANSVDASIRSSSTHYGPLIDISDVNIDVDSDVDRWVSRGAYGAILYGVFFLALAIFIALHANNEADFSFIVDSIAAFVMFVSKVFVVICARTVHKHLSSMSQQVARYWIVVIALSKALTAVCAFVLFATYLVLAIGGVDANRGDGTRRRLAVDDDWDHHGPTPDEKAELCAAGFFMMWSFLFTLVSQSVAGFAFASIYANAVKVFGGDRQIFRKVVSCWWAVLVGCTCGVGIALWLGVAISVIPALDISPLRMMGFFYSGAGVNQILAGIAMLRGNHHIRSYWRSQNESNSSQAPGPVVMGSAVVGKPVETKTVD